MNRNERDWSAVRAAVDARINELGLSMTEAARRTGMPKSALRAFLDGQRRPHGYTMSRINDALDLPYDHLRAIAEKRKPEAPPALVPDKETPVAAPAAALLSLMDLGPGAQMVADYKAYVSMVAKELREGMTREQRSNVGSFLHDLSFAVQYGN